MRHHLPFIEYYFSEQRRSAEHVLCEDITVYILFLTLLVFIGCLSCLVESERLL